MEKLQDPIPIYTIGYGSRSIEQFIEVLQHHKIAYLIDVRSTPYSRYKPEFSKEALGRRNCNGARFGMCSWVIRWAGIPMTKHVMMRNGQVDYEKGEGYRRATRAGLNVSKPPSLNNNVSRSCAAKGKPEECHRSKLIGASLDEQDISLDSY